MPSSDARTAPAIHATRDDAVRASRLVVAGELVAAITHDLRQPLTAIEMNVAAALRRLDLSGSEQPPAWLVARLTDAAEALRDALTEQQRMREALQVLQDLAARREPSFAPIDLAQSVDDVLRLIASDAAARRILIETRIAKELPRISADATLVRQALLNVLVDALEGTTRSARSDIPVVIIVRRRPADEAIGPHEPEDFVDVIVTHVGDREATADGWGLALARTVVDAHGGSLRTSGDAEHGLAVLTRWPVRTVTSLIPGATHARP